ncbi:MAG: hypothetical protein K6W08_12005, partial [Firmicutes bacterium]|nr:hypothetical protein [Bacillota bacterium]
PDRLTQRWQISRLRIYVNAQNALNFLSYKGFSPEIDGPPTRPACTRTGTVRKDARDGDKELRGHPA